MVCIETAEWTYDEATESLALPAVAVGPADELALTFGVAEGSLLSQRDRRLETCRAMLKTFRLNTWVKWEITRKLPELVLESSARGRTGGDLDRVKRGAVDGAAGCDGRDH